MTDEQKKSIQELRKSGLGYAAVSKKTGLSINTVKSYCRRNNVSKHTCKNCGKVVEQIPGRKEKKFCCDACRMAWWRTNADSMVRKSANEFTCYNCGRIFNAYGSRKFCSHDCYVAIRFGKEVKP